MTPCADRIGGETLCPVWQHAPGSLRCFVPRSSPPSAGTSRTPVRMVSGAAPRRQSPHHSRLSAPVRNTPKTHAARGTVLRRERTSASLAGVATNGNATTMSQTRR